MTNRNKETGLFGIAAALFGGTVAAVPFFACGAIPDGYRPGTGEE